MLQGFLSLGTIAPYLPEVPSYASVPIKQTQSRGDAGVKVSIVSIVELLQMDWFADVSPSAHKCRCLASA